MTPKRRALITLLKLSDLAVVIAAFSFALALTVDSGSGTSWKALLEMRVSIQNAMFVAAYLGAWHFVLKAFGLYRSYRLSPASRESKDVAFACLVATAPLVPFDLLLDFEYVNSLFLSAFGSFTFVTLILERRLLRAVARQVRRRGHNLRNVVVVGDGQEALGTSAGLVRRNDLGYRLVELIEITRSDSREEEEQQSTAAMERLHKLIEEQPIDEVFVALPLDCSQSLIWPIISLCEEQGVMVRVLARVADLSWGRAVIDEVGGKPVITIFSGPPDTLRLHAKRALDLVGSAVGLILLSPIMLMVALAIKMDSNGRVLFGQERVGHNRRVFRAWKFRTMVDGADKMQESLESLNEAEGPIFKIKEDPRITRVGSFLRRTSIDELPQLFNVLKGDMSLVGPRPLPLRDVTRIDVRWHKRRFSVKPGITCLWQINGREPTFDDWIKADMEYIDNWSLKLDARILMKTIPAVISGHGAH